MADNQIIHDVLENLNKWDRDNRNTTMSIPFYIKEKFKLEERECFKLTTKMVQAGLVSRYRDNDYIIKNKGREIADSTDDWLGDNKPTPTQPNLDFLRALNSTTTITKTSPRKNDKLQQYIKVSKEYIKKWWWAFLIPIFVGYVQLYMEYSWFIPKQNQNVPPTDTLLYKPTLKVKPLTQNKITDSPPTRTNLPVR